MIALQLKRGNSSFRAGLRLPTTTAEVGEAFSQLDSIKTSAPTIHENGFQLTIGHVIANINEAGD